MDAPKKVETFDGHNDAMQNMVEYRQDGRDFPTRSDAGHIDLPRAREGAW
jgi:membrane dipeptidase